MKKIKEFFERLGYKIKDFFAAVGAGIKTGLFAAAHFLFKVGTGIKAGFIAAVNFFKSAVGKKVGLALILFIVFTGALIPVMLNSPAIMVAFANSQSVYTQADIKAAREAGYRQGVGEREDYEKIIKNLKGQLVAKEEEWTKRYNDMVADYEGRIALLQGELGATWEYVYWLEDKLLEFGFDVNSVPREGALLGLQKSAYEKIKNDYLTEKAHWDEVYITIEDLPGLVEERDANNVEITKLSGSGSGSVSEAASQVSYYTTLLAAQCPTPYPDTWLKSKFETVALSETGYETAGWGESWLNNYGSFGGTISESEYNLVLDTLIRFGGSGATNLDLYESYSNTVTDLSTKEIYSPNGIKIGSGRFDGYNNATRKVYLEYYWYVMKAYQTWEIPRVGYQTNLTNWTNVRNERQTNLNDYNARNNEIIPVIDEMTYDKGQADQAMSKITPSLVIINARLALIDEAIALLPPEEAGAE
jgi:hypothetical protein